MSPFQQSTGPKWDSPERDCPLHSFSRDFHPCKIRKMSDEDGYDGADDFGQENYEDEYMMVRLGKICVT